MFIILGLQQFGLHRNRLNSLTMVLGRKWAVINYLRISKWAANYKKIANGLYAVCHRFGGSLVGLLSSCVHNVSQKRNLVNNRLYQRQTVRCQSNGNRASSVSDLPAPAAQTSAVGTACSRLPWPAVLPRRPHRPTILPSLA